MPKEKLRERERSGSAASKHSQRRIETNLKYYPWVILTLAAVGFLTFLGYESSSSDCFTVETVGLNTPVPSHITTNPEGFAVTALQGDQVKITDAKGLIAFDAFGNRISHKNGYGSEIIIVKHGQGNQVEISLNSCSK